VKRKAKRVKKARAVPAQSSGLERVPRDEKGRLLEGNPLRFRRGVSGNPGGLPTWVKAVRDSLEDASAEGAALLTSIIRGEEVELLTRDGDVVKVKPSVESRLKAVEIALSYTVPRPSPRNHEAAADAGPELRALPTEALEAIEAILDAHAAPPPTTH
jgi:hypothetical protein